jgi:TonB family protein
MDTRTLSRIVLLLLLAVVPPAVASDSDIQHQLNGLWKDKQLSLREPDAAREIRFDAQGLRTSVVKDGYWYENMRLQFSRVKVKHDEIIIEGKRVKLAFSVERRDFTSVATDRDIRIRIQRNGLAEISPVFSKIFLTKDETLADFAPDYWYNCLHGDIVKRKCVLPGHDPLKPTFDPDKVPSSPPALRVGGGVKPPHAIFDPDPQYEALASQAKLQGKMVLWVVIGPDGLPQRIRIVEPLGMGLDDRAAETVKTWKFDPATKDGKPVSVQVYIEVNFRLY